MRLAVVSPISFLTILVSSHGPFSQIFLCDFMDVLGVNGLLVLFRNRGLVGLDASNSSRDIFIAFLKHYDAFIIIATVSNLLIQTPIKKGQNAVNENVVHA